MPQLQSGQVAPGQVGVPKLYGVGKTENTVPFQERLMRFFKPQEFVTIKNIDTVACYWQYMPADNEHEAFSEDGMQQIITRESPEMWVINPGDTEVLVGASAYRALDVMYKNYSAKKMLQRFNDPNSPLYDEKGQHLPKNFNFADGGAQDEFIENAYLGKATPTFQGFEQPPAMPNVVAPPPPVDEEPETPNPPVDENLPKPKTTDGAPLAPVTYADPGDPKGKTLKELQSAKK